MGREIKRVPVDFDWPLNQIWSGFLMPDELDLPPCSACDGKGYDPSWHWVAGIVHLLLMLSNDLDAQQRGRGLHPWLAKLDNIYTVHRPTEIIRQLTAGLAGGGQPDHIFGHDSLDRLKAVRTVIAAAGFDPDTWGLCATCQGRGNISSEEQRAAHEAWEATVPPTGEGWQLWETTSEGSPISPVFVTGDELAEWMSHNPCGFAESRISLETALAWVHGPGWSPSAMVIDGRGFTDGITAMTAVEEQGK